MKTKYILILTVVGLVIGFLLGDSCARKDFPTVTSTVTVTDTVYITIKDSTGIVPIPVEVVEDSTPVVIEVPDVTTPDPTDTVEVETTKYEGQEVLDNGIIDYEIYADNLVATNFMLTVEEKVIYNTITNTIVNPTKSQLFLVSGVDLSWQTKYPQAARVGLMYARRNKWTFGVGLRHDFGSDLPVDNSTTITFDIGIGLFKNK